MTLVDFKEYFEYTPGILRCFCDAAYLPELTCKLEATAPNARIVVAEMVGMSPTEVHLLHNPPPSDGGAGERSPAKKSPLRLKFDYLVLATGSTYNAPIKPLAAEPTLASRQGSWDRAAIDLKAARSVIIVGAGPVGLELAGEILTYFPEKAITFVDMAPRVLSGFDAGSVAHSERWLKQRNVTFRMGIAFEQINTDSVVLKGGEVLHADLVYPCIGVFPNTSFLKSTPLKVQPCPDQGAVAVGRESQRTQRAPRRPGRGRRSKRRPLKRAQTALSPPRLAGSEHTLLRSRRSLTPTAPSSWRPRFRGVRVAVAGPHGLPRLHRRQRPPAGRHHAQSLLLWRHDVAQLPRAQARPHRRDQRASGLGEHCAADARQATAHVPRWRRRSPALSKDLLPLPRPVRARARVCECGASRSCCLGRHARHRTVRAFDARMSTPLKGSPPHPSPPRPTPKVPCPTFSPPPPIARGLSATLLRPWSLSTVTLPTTHKAERDLACPHTTARLAARSYDAILGFNGLVLSGFVAALMKWVLEWTKVSAAKQQPVGVLFWRVADTMSCFMARTILPTPAPP